jgi:hypothetical protein
VYRSPYIRRLHEVYLRMRQPVRVCLLIVVFYENVSLMCRYFYVVRTIVFVTEICEDTSNPCVVETYQNRNLL